MLCYRIYAVTLRNVPITIAFGTITVSQLTVGLWSTILTAKGGGESNFPHPMNSSLRKIVHPVEITSVQSGPLHKYPSMHSKHAYTSGIKA